MERLCPAPERRGEGDKLASEQQRSSWAVDTRYPACRYQVVGGIISPVSDAYGKQGLVAAKHRVAMAKIALRTSDWVAVDEWESRQPDWNETVATMRYHYGRVVERYQSQVDPHGNQPVEAAPSPQLKLLCGADFLDSFSVPGLWRDVDVEEVAGRFGLVCVSRGAQQPDRAVHESDLLSRHRGNVHLVREWVRNETSATEVRRALRRGLSVKYLLPDDVIDYIQQHGLYTHHSEQRNRGATLRPISKQGLLD
ncbi:nicotinamide/nicotinic acid mononucleotide adenylyltransferase 3-like [Engraulis encrasicolus]|uniref:nicotinamide/nicotinic acid mononucleotide adenylyltransferase 3-like n=1 Tax=Engraulis encrasicolus TaxID=184585 RepID=UPI002FD51C05